MKPIRLLLLLTLLSNIALGDTNAVILHKDEKAPFDGVLLTREAADDQYRIGQERQSYKLLNDSFKVSLELETKNRQESDAKVEILKVDLVNTTKALNEVKSTSTWTKIGYFSLGIITTYFAIKGAHELYH